eukprot:355151-Chlamydomonas_euryale.AAC.3
MDGHKECIMHGMKALHAAWPMLQLSAMLGERQEVWGRSMLDYVPAPYPLLDPLCPATLNTGIPFVGPLPATLTLTLTTSSAVLLNLSALGRYLACDKLSTYLDASARRPGTGCAPCNRSHLAVLRGTGCVCMR